MQYKVHSYSITRLENEDKLEGFLNNLKGEVQSIFLKDEPAASSIHSGEKFLIIVEKTK